MKYKTLLISLQLLFCLTASAQNKQGVVNYRFSTKLFDMEINQKSVLYFDDAESVFIHSKGKKGQIMKKADGTDLLEGEDPPAHLSGWYQDTIGEVIFKNLAARKLICRTFFFRVAYLVEEPKFPIIKWNILTEQRKIGSFNCQKATTRFRGRNYTAWFTMDIPISNGPWKLQGLPGLILEAVDDTGEVKFLFSSIELPLPYAINIKAPTDGKKVNFETYKKAEDIEFENHKRLTESTDYGRGGGVTVGKRKVNAIEKEYEQ